MTIYRAICYTGTNIELKELGVCWSLSEKAAFPYGDKSQETTYYVYTAFCEDKDVNWPATSKANIEWPHEQEIVLNKGVEITILSIKKLIQPCQTELWRVPICYLAKA